MSDDAVGPQRATSWPKTCRQIEAQTKQVKAELATEPRRPESFPQCPDTGLRFSTSSYEPAGPWFVEDASCLRVCTCTRKDVAMMIALALEHAADAADSIDPLRAMLRDSHAGEKLIAMAGLIRSMWIDDSCWEISDWCKWLHGLGEQINSAVE